MYWKHLLQLYSYGDYKVVHWHLFSQDAIQFSAHTLLYNAHYEKRKQLVSVRMFQMPMIVVPILLLYEHIPH